MVERIILLCVLLNAELAESAEKFAEEKSWEVKIQVIITIRANIIYFYAHKRHEKYELVISWSAYIFVYFVCMVEIYYIFLGTYPL